MNKKGYLFIFILICSLLFVACVSRQPQPGDEESLVQELIILHTNDFHGHPLKFYNYPAPDVGGLPAIATFVKETRAEYEHVMVLDAGDINTGRPESNFFNAEPDITGYNYIGYDAMVLGNHEFDHSVTQLKEQMALAEFPFISANIKTKDGEPLASPYIIKEFDGFTVGVFGLTLSETESIGNPAYVKDLTFEDEVAAAKKIVSELKNRGVDIIIALTHMGIYSDNTKGSRRIASQVEGIDLIIDGHTHTKMKKPLYESGVPIVQAWQWGLYMGKARFTISQKKVTGFSWEPVPINLKTREKKDDGSSVYHFVGTEYKEDEELLALLQPYGDKVDSMLSEVIGSAEETFFNGETRSGETALGDLVADSMLWYTENLDVDFAVQNGGGIRADLPGGDISKKVIYEILPFDNSIMVVTLDGKQVRELFDYIATIPTGSGAFAQVSEGVSFTINYTEKTCENVLINGKPIDPEGTYRVATNSYMAEGGDGYAVFTKALDTYDTSYFQRDGAIDYIKYLGGSISPEVNDRITLVGSSTARLIREEDKEAA